MHKIISVLGALVLLAGCASSPQSAGGSKSPSKQKAPAWVENPRSVYPEAQFVSAVGYAKDRETAEKSAVSALIAVFGQNIKGETRISERYTEAVRSGAVTVTEDSELNRAMSSSVSMNSVIGAEIKDVWEDGAGTVYAVAVMDKLKASSTYSRLLETNEETIASLRNIRAEEADTLDAYARHDLAAAIADTNQQFLNVLSIVNPAMAAAKRASVSSGDDIRLECLRIAQTIPIAVTVTGDRDERIRSSFADVLSASGFKTGNSSSRYSLEVSLSLSEVALANNDNKFVRYVIDSKLTDSATAQVLLPWNVNGREGHTSVPEAENRAFRAAEKKIRSEFGGKFTGYLSQLAAKR